MIYLQIGCGVLFFVLLVVIAVTGIMVFRQLKTHDKLSPQDASIDENISAIVNILKEEKEAAEAEARDKELIKEAKAHMKGQASPIVSSAGHDDHVKQSDGDLIPFGLSEMDREILNDFYKK